MSNYFRTASDPEHVYERAEDGKWFYYKDGEGPGGVLPQRREAARDLDESARRGDLVSVSVPLLDRVEVTEEGDGSKWDPRHIGVWPAFRGVDRPQAAGWGVKDRKMAARLIAAIRAGAAMTAVGVGIDNRGQTYVKTQSHVLARMMNAELHRLGF